MLCKIIDIIYAHETDGTVNYDKANFDDKCVFVIYARSAQPDNRIVKIIVKNFKFWCYLSEEPNSNSVSRLQRVLRLLNYRGVIEYHRPFEGFCGNHKYPYIRVDFDNYEQMHLLVKKLSEKHSFVHFYETDIDPKIRFIHATDLESSGYIDLQEIKPVITMDYKPRMFKLENNSNEQIDFKILSFDIECDSYYGDFPLAKGDSQNFCKQLFRMNIKNKQTFLNVMGIVLDPNYNLIEYPRFFDNSDFTIEEALHNLIISSESDTIVKQTSEHLESVDQRQWFPNTTAQLACYYELKNYIETIALPKMIHQGYKVNLDTLLLQCAAIVVSGAINTRQRFDITPVNFKHKKLSSGFVLTEKGITACEQLFKYYSDYDKFYKVFQKTFTIDGDHVIQIGSTVTQGNKELYKCICVLNDVENITNEELIRLENTFNRKDVSLLPEKDLQSFLKAHDAPKEMLEEPCSVDLETRVKWKTNKELELQLERDHSIVKIIQFVNNTKLLEPVAKAVSKARQQIYTNEILEDSFHEVIKKHYKSFNEFIPNDVIANNIASQFGLVATDPVNKSVEMYYKINNPESNVTTIYGSEAEMLVYWSNLIKEIDPDIVTGYNIFGFDFEFMFTRAKELNVLSEFTNMGRINKSYSEIVKSTLKTNAYGENNMTYIPMIGRVIIDLFKFVRIEYKLDSYKLDNVAAKFLFKEKADVPPAEIFRKQRLTAVDRKDVAMYCIIDCMLCNRLINTLQVIERNSALATISKVPLNYLFLRGQSVKLLSLLTYYCDNIKGDVKYLIEDKRARKDFENPPNEKYEGATVLDPVTKLHNIPISVGDFNSLYPNSIIARNMSHDTLVCPGSEYWDNNRHEPDYERIEQDNFTLVYSFNDPNKPGVYDTKPGVVYTPGNEETRVYFIKQACPEDLNNNELRGIIPMLMNELIQYRKKVRKIQAGFKKGTTEWNIYESQQLAAKILCNSQYGILGASTSKIYNKKLAACTTAVGRSMICAAKGYVESVYTEGHESQVLFKVDDSKQKQFDKEFSSGKKQIYKLISDKKYKDFIKFATEEQPGIHYYKLPVYTKETKCVYGDTDSIFIQFHNFYDPECKLPITGLTSVFISHALCEEACNNISYNFIKSPPERIEFEKTIWPFIIFAKKRYFGRYYTKIDSDYHYDNSMGIISKRRDQAKITQSIYTGILDILMNDSIKDDKLDTFCEDALEYFKQRCYDMITDKYPKDEFIISKTLKSEYSNRLGIAHAVLADRQAARDPGNAFSINDRVPYCYFFDNNFYSSKQKILQGDRIETPEYIAKKGLPLDYVYYIEHQICEPVEQIFELLEYNSPGILQKFKDFIEQIKKQAKINCTRKDPRGNSILNYFAVSKIDARKRIKKN